MASGVMPKCRNRSGPGALAPNPVMPMNTPSGPSQRSQPNPHAASIPTRSTEPSTGARALSSMAANSSQQGRDTTAAGMPSSASRRRASSATATSDPDAISVACRGPSASAST